MQFSSYILYLRYTLYFNESNKKLFSNPFTLFFRRAAKKLQEKESKEIRPLLFAFCRSDETGHQGIRG